MKTEDQVLKPIAVRLKDSRVSGKVDAVSAKLRMSRSGFGAVSIEFVLDLLERGKAQMVNGQIVISEKSSKEAA